MVHHSLRVLGPVGITAKIADIVLNAHAAVVVFFVLSGFVLGKSLRTRGLTAGTITQFYVRRIFRIYPAMWVAITLGLGYFLFVRDIPAPHFAAWANKHYDPALLSAVMAAETYLGINNYLLPTLWTITVELAASVLLPFIVLAMTRWRWSTLPLLIGLAILSMISGVALRTVPLYMIDFALGAALAVYGTDRIGRGSALAAAGAVTILLFFRQLHGWTYDAAVPGLVEGLAATVLIATIVQKGSRILNHRALTTIGDWSYSIYLLHLPIAYAIARLIDHFLWVTPLDDRAPLLVMMMTTVVTVPLAALMYRFIELPGIVLGKQFLEGVSRRRRRSSSKAPTAI